LVLALLGQDQPDDNEGYTCGWNEDTVRLTSERPQPDFVGDPSLHGGKLFGSSHTGGFNAVLADGSVRRVSYSVNQATFKAFGATADGQPFNADDL
jgi:prepilin-type processing-associated H-X9-DG protein